MKDGYPGRAIGILRNANVERREVVGEDSVSGIGVDREIGIVVGFHGRLSLDAAGRARPPGRARAMSRYVKHVLHS